MAASAVANVEAVHFRTDGCNTTDLSLLRMAGLAAEEAAVAASAAAATAAAPAEANRSAGGAATQQQLRQQQQQSQLQLGAAHEYLLVEFALTLLHGCASTRFAPVNSHSTAC